MAQLRPLGIPAVEDKLLQLAVARILEAIYEQDFLRCSYGYRPQVGALEAVDKLTIKLQFGRYHYVVEADITRFFDTIDHDWLLQMLAERIDDRRAAAADPEVAESRGAGHRRPGAPPGDGDPARGRRFHPSWPTSTCTTCSICGLRKWSSRTVEAKRA